MALRTTPTTPTPVDEALALGRAAFSRLFKAYLSQTTQYKLLKSMEAYFNARLFHSSQLGGIRDQTLREPSPKVFIALGYYNVAHARSLGWPEDRIDATSPLELPRQLPESVRDIWEAMEPLTDAEGVAMGPTGLFEAFSGLLALPVSPERLIPPEAEEAVCRSLGHYLRIQLPLRGVDWFTDMPLLRKTVPCIEDLLMDRTVQGDRLLAALPQLAVVADTTDDALWDLVCLSLPS